MLILITFLGVCTFILGAILIICTIENYDNLQIAVLFSIVFCIFLIYVNKFFKDNIVVHEYTKIVEAVPFKLEDKKYKCKKYKYSSPICTLVATRKRYTRIENSEWEKIE